MGTLEYKYIIYGYMEPLGTKGLNLTYHNKETILFAIGPYYANLK